MTNTDWFTSFIEDENTSRETTRTAVLLAKVRYDEQLSGFVGEDENRLAFVRGEIDRIADETAAETGAQRDEVFQKLMKVIEADVLLPVSKPESVELTNEEGGSPPEKFDSEDLPEPQGTTSVLDRGPILEEEILHPENSKLIPVQDGALKHGCVRCETKEASEDSPVCDECNTELVALAADDAPPLDGEESPDGFVAGDRVVLTDNGAEGTITEKREAEGGHCYVIELDIAVDGVRETPCITDGFARAAGDKASKVAQGELGAPPAPAAPAGTAQPLNPNAPYQCVTCGFTGTFQAVNDHIVTAQDTEHMRAKQNPGQAQAPPTSPTQQQTVMQPYGKSAADGHEGEEGDHEVVVNDPQQSVTPGGKFSDIVEAMANHAAAREFSTIADDEIQAIAGQYSLDPNEVRSKVIVSASFGDFVALNGKVGDTEIPEGYTPVSIDGMGGVVEAHEAIVPTNSAVRKVADDLGMEADNVYSSIKEAMGADLTEEYHTTVSGEHTFYMPQELLDQGELQAPEAPAPPPAQPQQQPSPMMGQQPQPMGAAQKAKLAQDLRIELIRTAHRLRKLEAEGVEGTQEV